MRGHFTRTTDRKGGCRSRYCRIDAREITLSRLRALDICEVIINVHHFADMIVEYLKTNDNFGMQLEVSREEVLLDTGGGLKRAASFFLEDSNGFEKPFILHNVDVISNN